uniref:SUN domain-containing protein n=1 Tax=Acrobeloides nanus TaxID=290746 RepID=A0A914DRE4_9BILA
MNMKIYWSFCLILFTTQVYSIDVCSSPSYIISSILRGSIPLRSLRPAISQENHIETDPSCPKPGIHEIEPSVQQCGPDNLSTDDSTKHTKTKLENGSITQESEEQIAAKNLSEPPMATFEEWTKEKLSKQEKRKPFVASEQEKANADDPTNTTPETIEIKEEIRVVQEQMFIVPITTAKRNYASKECGAKIVFANPEAENKGAILNDKEKDEYMRNPCEKAQNKFLVIELCETIQPTIVEIANFELFSSNPREFRVSISERYPAIEWIDAGEFIAQDTRDIQTFSIIPKGSYAKFVRLELLSHYGKEHYCTLSLFRIYGISMVDEYEAEADAIIEGQPIQEITTIVHESVESIKALHEQALIDTQNSTNFDNSQVKSIETQETIKEPIDEKRDENKSRDIVGTVVNVVGNVFGTAIGKFLPFKLEGSNKTYVWRLSDCWMCPKKKSDARRSFPFCLAFNQQKYHTLFVKKVNKSTEKPVKAVILLPKLTRGQEKMLYLLQSWLTELSLQNQCVNETKITESKPQTPEIVVTDVKITTEPVTSTKPQPVSKGTSADPETNLSTAPLKNGNGGNGNKPENIANGNGMPRYDPLPGIRPSHKESIFMKLNKRLTALELNISLSSEYLSELSRRYVAQTEENKKQHERVLKAVEEITNESAKQLKAQFSEQIIDLQQQIAGLANILRSITSLHTTNQSPYPISVTEMPPGANCMPDQKTPLLYSEDHLWTTEQIIYIVIGAQFVTLLFVFLFTVMLQHLRQSKNELTHEEVQKMIRQELDSRNNEKQRCSPDIDRQVSLPPSNKDLKRKKKKRKLSILTGSSAEPWDSAMETSSSLPPTGTPTPSELSSEIEHPNFNKENGYAAQTPLASEQPLRIKFDRLANFSLVDTNSLSVLQVSEEPIAQCSSPPWKLVIPNKSKKKNQT